MSRRPGRSLGYRLIDLAGSEDPALAHTALVRQDGFREDLCRSVGEVLHDRTLGRARMHGGRRLRPEVADQVVARRHRYQSRSPGYRSHRPGLGPPLYCTQPGVSAAGCLLDRRIVQPGRIGIQQRDARRNVQALIGEVGAALVLPDRHRAGYRTVLLLPRRSAERQHSGDSARPRGAIHVRGWLGGIVVEPGLETD